MNLDTAATQGQRDLVIASRLSFSVAQFVSLVIWISKAVNFHLQKGHRKCGNIGPPAAQGRRDLVTASRLSRLPGFALFPKKQDVLYQKRKAAPFIATLRQNTGWSSRTLVHLIRNSRGSSVTGLALFLEQ